MDKPKTSMKVKTNVKAGSVAGGVGQCDPSMFTIVCPPPNPVIQLPGLGH
jgi:hypothetical protein